MGNVVWVFGKQMGKLVVLGEQARKAAQEANDGGIGIVAYAGHTLRTYDGYASRCLTCGRDSLVRGDTCDKIQEHNAMMDGEA